MWPFAQREQLCLILAAVCGGSFCQALSTSAQTLIKRRLSSHLLQEDRIQLLTNPPGLEPRASSAFRNSTSTSSSSSSSWSTQTSPIVEPALITPTTTLLSSSSTQNFTSTITSAPMNPWGDQIIPINTCSVTASSNNEIQWTPCAV
jgi:hypothetical protein